ncbi:MAG: hypothetical protein LC687_00480 [Actinobacteria bacterium]|nr:hypothetical protein [Actinomycetota bacterium]
MASRDGIGAPRRLSALAREDAILTEARRLRFTERRGLRHEDALRACAEATGLIPSRKQIDYSLQRLAIDNKLERRGGYVWYPVGD